MSKEIRAFTKISPEPLGAPDNWRSAPTWVMHSNGNYAPPVMTIIDSTPDPRRLSPREERAMLIVTCLAGFLFFNSFGSIGVALPTIQKQFGNSLAEVQWITLMGVVTISSLSLCFGRAGGIFGQRRFYKIGVALYAAGAGLGALSASFIELLLARAVMALGLAMALPMSTAILASSFDASRRGRVLGLLASAIAVGRMTGPTIGGILMEFGGWPWIFWMNCFIGLAVTMAVAKIFRGPGARRPEPFDVWGALTLLCGYPALLVGLSFGASLGWSSPPILGAFFVAAIALGSFLAIELNAARPLIDVAMFKNKLLAAALATVMLSSMIYHPIALCAPLYLQNGLGISALAAGFVLAVLPLSSALAAPLSGRLADRFDASTIAALGLTMIAGGIAGYAAVDSISRLPAVVAVLALIGLGVGCFTPANQKAAFASVRQEDYGVLAAMLSSFGTAAGTVGTTIAVALMEISGGRDLWTQPAALSSAQQFAFSWLAPVGFLAVTIALVGRSRPAMNKA